MPRTFLITGTSTGFGAELVKVVLAKGDNVVATARDPSKLNFSGTTDNNYLALPLDVTSKPSIEKAFKSAQQKFPKIDVVINNAGYGLTGEFESLSDNQIRSQMEVNFFGLLDVTRVALETMRNQTPSGGVIQQVTSIGGLNGVSLFSIYCASKFAVNGFTESLAKELKPEWGIKLTCIEPGGFRTDWSGRSMSFAENKNPAYDHLDAKKHAESRHMQQPGDPRKCAEVMYELATMEEPPLHCVIGTDAHKTITDRLNGWQESVKKYEKLSTSTNVDDYQG